MNIFCYGTLEDPKILNKVIGREVPTMTYVLDNYKRVRVESKHEFTIVKDKWCTVKGKLFKLKNAEEVKKLNDWESTYKLTNVSDEHGGISAYILGPKGIKNI